jgi:excisionase family DNA binding protein
MINVITLSLDEFIEIINKAVEITTEVVINKLKNEEEMLTAKEAAKYLNISAQTLNTLRRNNKIPYKEVGERKFLYPKSKLSV